MDSQYSHSCCQRGKLEGVNLLFHLKNILGSLSSMTRVKRRALFQLLLWQCKEPR